MEASGPFYPLKIYALTDDEKKLVVTILESARHSHAYLLKDLESELGKYLGRPSPVSLRRLGKLSANRTNNKSEALYEIWVFLYNFVMSDLIQRCQVMRLTEVEGLIMELRRLSIESGRYANDMHIFNYEYMFLDTSTVKVDPKYLAGSYIGFRYDSSSTDIILSVMRVRVAQDRFVFRSKLLNQFQGRISGGLAYELQGNLYLFGFLNGVQGAEYYALQSEDEHYDILFGLMSIINRERVPHAKQCCFVRTTLLDGMEKFTDDEIEIHSGMTKILRGSKRFLTDDGHVILSHGRTQLDVDNYLSRETIIRPRNAGRPRAQPR